MEDNIIIGIDLAKNVFQLQGDSEKLRFPVSGDEFDGTAAIILDHFNRSCR